MPEEPRSHTTGVTVDLSASTWTCFCCAKEQRDSDEMPQYCPKCGGVWVRPIVARRSRWFRIRCWLYDRGIRWGGWDG